jgi:hypothetical protein
VKVNGRVREKERSEGGRRGEERRERKSGRVGESHGIQV